MTDYVQPRGPALAALAQSADEAPVFMLNLLRFKEHADGIDAEDELSGTEAYARYAAATAEHLARVGGAVVWAGACDESVIGPDGGEWDLAAVVRYPSRKAFLAMIADPAYQAIHAHREAAVADSRLVACSGMALND